MRLHLALVLLAITVGCKPTAEEEGPTADQAFVTAAADQDTPGAAPTLTLLPELARGVAALPRLTGDTEAIRAINADLERMDAQVRKAIPECFAEGVQHPDWTRIVDAPSTGPRFFSLTILDDLYCGGNHPNNARLSVTYDLSTGRRVNWSDLLPVAFVGPLDETTSVFDFDFTVSRSPTLFGWLRGKIPVQTEEDRSWFEDCAPLYQGGVGGSSLMISIDAEHEGLAIETVSLPHAARACGSNEVMPIAELQRIGAAPMLIEAIRTAHRDGSWRKNLGSGT